MSAPNETTLEERLEALTQQVEALEEQFSVRIEQLETQGLALVNGQPLRFLQFDVLVFHETQSPKSTSIPNKFWLPLSDTHITDPPKKIHEGYGERILGAWMIHTDHRSNNPLYSQLGYLAVSVDHADNSLLLAGSASQSLQPTTFTIYVLYLDQKLNTEQMGDTVLIPG